MADPFKDRAWLDYAERFRTDVIPKMLSSRIMLSIASDSNGLDIQQACELGACLLLGKPLLIVCPKGATIPDALRRAATWVIEDWDIDDPHAQEQLVSFMKEHAG